MTELQEVQITEEKPLLPGQDIAKDAEIAARILLDHGQEHNIETPFGTVHATTHGSPRGRRPVIVTFHDVGLDHKTCFDALFKNEDMQEIVKNFLVCHIDAPGQEDGATPYTLGYQYPSLDQLSEMFACVLQHFKFQSIIGIGVGAGAYVLSRYALTNPQPVEGLILINIDSNARGWMDWAAQKLSGLTGSVVDLILSHLFSQDELTNNTELVQTIRQRMVNAPNLPNIQLYWNSYNSRRDLEMDRATTTLKCPVLLVVGDQAPHEDAVVECNAKLDPTNTSFLKMADSGGLPQITQPGKLTEAFKYFIQGMGYMPSSAMTRLSRSRTTSLSSATSFDGTRSRSRTLSQGSEIGQMASSPSQTMEVSC